MDFPKKGIYRHFKGNRYELIDFARHSETQEWMAVYRALYGDGGLWVRPLEMWSEIVERDGYRGPRFIPEEDDAPKPFPTKWEVLKQYFGYDGFREGQEEVVDAILSGRDTLAVMPTGAGKSICYQVPAMVQGGVAIIISPLISLMKDQVQTLKQNGIPAAYLNSSLTERQFELALHHLTEGRYRLVYVAPERLMTPRFIAAMSQIEVSMVAVDEAHCISQWGQDFRPSYLEIPNFIRALQKRPVVCAFTATATARVRKDIEALLCLNNPFVRITGFDRKNLYYSVSEPSSKDAELIRLLRDYAGMSGIVYCATRKKVEAVCEKLLSHGFSATRYHAGLSDAERQENQDDFIYDRREIMVATNAFGMGIDKSNVRFVIHYNMPKDVESYYQEAGRAGRDGERADCHLLFGKQDVLTQQFFIEHMGEEAGLEGEALKNVQESARKRLEAMTRYCRTTECLRGYILRYFGEAGVSDCGFCVNCLAPAALEDMTQAARFVLKAVWDTRERFGKSTVIDLLRGARSERVEQFHLEDDVCFGALQSISQSKLSSLMDWLVDHEYLRQENMQFRTGVFPILKLGERCKLLLSGEERALVPARPQKKDKKEKTPLPSNVDRDLFERLRALRKEIAASRGVPPYVVFPDTTLREMAKVMPSNMEEMGKVSGIGVVKLREFGKRFLKEIQKYRDESAVSAE